MSDYKYFVTFNSRDADTNPGVTIFKNEKTPLRKLKGLDYPHVGVRAAGIYTKGDEYVIRAVTSKGNLFEIDPFCHNGAEKYLKDSWKACSSVGTYRDCTVLVNKHIFLVNPEDIQRKLDAGGDWVHNEGCVVHDGKVYVVSNRGNLWKITLKGWSVSCDVEQVNIGEILPNPKFVAVDPRNGNLYIGDNLLKMWDGKKLHTYPSVYTDDANAGGITLNDNKATLWFSVSKGYVSGGAVKKVNIDNIRRPEDTGLISNGLGFV